MTNLIQYLANNNAIQPPPWLPDNVHYLVEMGSTAYGVASAESDIDMYGFCIPLKSDVFPHLRGEIPGFGRQIQRFEQYQQHHIKDPANAEIEYDLQVYSIVKYVQLCMENNPNMVDSLYVPQRCVRHITAVGHMIRDNRKKFLHKGCFSKFKGYAYSQKGKMKSKTPKEGKRQDLIDRFGYDVKFGYHLVRLALECEMILAEQDLDIERNRELLKSIKRGEWKEQDIYDWFNEKEKVLDRLYHSSTLPYSPNEEEIKELLLTCLEHHYGSMEDCLKDTGLKEQRAIKTLRQIRDMLNAAIGI